MTLWRWLLAPALVALALGTRGDAPDVVSAELSRDYVPGELLVKARPWVSEAAVAAAVGEGARPIERLRGIGVLRVGLPDGADVAEAVERYRRLPWVEFAEPNYYVRADVVPNDPCYASGAPCPSTQSWYYDLIQAPAAWDLETGDPSIVVAVVDSGVDLDHPDLDDNLWVNAGDPVDGLDNDGNGIVDDVNGAAFISIPTTGCRYPQPPNDPQDDKGHGTMVAGIVGAETDNGAGVAGTAWGVKLMPVKVLDCAGSGSTFDVMRGIDYAAAQGADIINMSFGMCVRNPCFTGPCQQPPSSGTLQTAIQAAQAAYGSSFVGAAGNENCPYVAYPAAFPEVIAVGASGGQSSPDARAACPSYCFSNWGPEVDVVAPGVGICSTAWNPTYDCGGGTSFAAPLVSGLVALVLSRNPGFGDAEVRSVLCASAVDLPDGSTPGWDGCGRINMHGALLSGFGVWRPSNGTWYVLPDRNGVQWGKLGDIPVPGDYTVDGTTDFAVWRPSNGTWYVYADRTGVKWGLAGDVPVPGDYNGDPKTDFAVWRPSNGTWYVSPNRTGVQWGLAGDIPVPGDYNGDGKTDFAVWRPSNGTWYVLPDRTGLKWGLSDDVPVPGDYNGDSKADVAVWRPSNGTWYTFRHRTGVHWGLPDDVPIPGD